MDVPVSEKHRTKFLSLCEQLKRETAVSEWTQLFKPNIIDDSNLTSCLVELIEDAESADESVMDVDKENTTKELSLLNFVDEKTIYELKAELVNFNQHEADKKKLSKFAVLCTLPPSLIPNLCEELEIVNLDNSIIAAILNYFCCLEPAISLSTASALIQYVVYLKIIDRNVGNIQALYTAIIQFSENYASAVFEGLFLPCIMCKELGNAQMDVLNRLIKSVKVPNNVIHSSLRRIFEEVEPRENMFLILQSLIEKRVPCDENMCCLFVRKLKLWSLSYNSDVKFTRLLISVISLYGNKAKAEQISILSSVVSSNSTLLRNTAEKALNKHCQLH